MGYCATKCTLHKLLKIIRFSLTVQVSPKFVRIYCVNKEKGGRGWGEGGRRWGEGGRGWGEGNFERGNP